MHPQLAAGHAVACHLEVLVGLHYSDACGCGIMHA